MDYPVYKNSPITEALFDIRTERNDPISPDFLESLHKEFISDFPEKRILRLWEGKFGEVASVKNMGVEGFHFWSNDKTKVIHFKANGFAYSQLKPYRDWNQLISGRSFWELYRKKVQPNAVTRLAVRYINSISIPEVNFRLQDYFTSPPTQPEAIPSIIDQFIQRTVVKFEKESCTAAITLASKEPNPERTATPILFDLDIYRDIHLEPNKDDILWNTMAELRNVAFRIFDSYLTSKTKDLFR